MVPATGSLNASLSMTVDRAGSFDRPIGLATDLAVEFFGLVGADLLEEAATRVGPSTVVFLFFSTANASNNMGRVKWVLTYSEKVSQERASSTREPSS